MRYDITISLWEFSQHTFSNGWETKLIAKESEVLIMDVYIYVYTVNHVYTLTYTCTSPLDFLL